MKKTTLALLFFALPLVAFCQSSYRIDAIQGGGFYLVEITKDTAGRVNEFPQRFNTPEQLDGFVKYLRDQSAGAVKQADKILADAQSEAKKLKDAAPRFTAAAASIEQVGKAYFNPTPTPPPAAPAAPPAKAKKSKKTKT